MDKKARRTKKAKEAGDGKSRSGRDSEPASLGLEITPANYSDMRLVDDRVFYLRRERGR